VRLPVAVPSSLALLALLAGCTSADEGTVPEGSVTATAPAPTTVPPAGLLVVHAVGETTFDAAVVPAAAADPATSFAAVAGLFAEDDLTIVPLACPVGSPTLMAQTPCSADALAAMASAGVDVVTLATDSLGPADAAATADAVRAAGMVPTGAGVDAAAAIAPAVVEVGGRTLAVLSVSTVGPDTAWATATTPGVADGRDPAVVAAAVLEARAVADLVVVSVHLGEEQAQGPRDEDEALVRAYVDAGADVVVGHGPHRLHRFEAYQAGLLYLSLGDFVGPGTPPPTTDTGVARVVWSAEEPLLGCLLHATISAPGVPILDDPPGTVCPGEV